MKEIDLIKGYLEFEEIPFVEETDLATIMKASRGRVNPAEAAAVWIYPTRPNRTLITGLYQAIDFVQKAGLRKC